MSPQGKAEFQLIIAAKGYYIWSQLTDKILKDNERIYECLSEFIQHQDFIYFISKIN